MKVHLTSPFQIKYNTKSSDRQKDSRAHELENSVESTSKDAKGHSRLGLLASIAASGVVALVTSALAQNTSTPQLVQTHLLLIKKKILKVQK